MSIDTSGVRGYVWKKGEGEVLKCGCRVKCGTFPQIVVSCQEQPKSEKLDCVVWKWEQEHLRCKGVTKCMVRADSDEEKA